MSAVAALEGPDEALMVERLQRFRAAIAGRSDRGSDRGMEDDVVRADAALAEVDDYFRRVLRAVPPSRAYLDELAARPA